MHANDSKSIPVSLSRQWIELTTLNLRIGYYHIELGKDSQAKTAFITPFGKYEFNMAPFGLAQAPAYFQALVSKVLKGLHKFAVMYSQ